MGQPVSNDQPPAALTGGELLAVEAALSPASHSDIQYGHTAGVIDLTWGHPDPSAFAGESIAIAARSVMDVNGWQALSYGAPAGAASVREGIAEHLCRVDCETSVDDVLITAGSSGGLDMILSLIANRGDVVFVEQPTYFLALRIFADHGLTVVGLSSDEHGPDPDQFASAARQVKARGANPFLYLVSTFANPTGRCLAPPRAAELLDAAASAGAVVIDDDVYRDTSASAPQSLWSINSEVVRLGSFSKSLAPGLRVGYVTASKTVLAKITECGVLDSGGGVNHFAAMIVGDLLKSGTFREIAAAGQTRLAARRSALIEALDPTLLAFDAPAGGFFVWIRLPDDVSSDAVVATGFTHGVMVSNGRNFFAGPHVGEFVRASFSMLDEQSLIDGAQRLNDVVLSLCG